MKSQTESEIAKPSGLTEAQEDVLRIILDTVPAPARHAARNAVHNLGMAEQIADIDKTMAAFRSITAEEEAATALFHSLLRHKYPGAQRLRPRDHRFKNSVSPFLDSVGHVIAEAQQLGTLIIQIRYPRAGNSQKPDLLVWYPDVPIGKRIQPNPPLGFSMTEGDNLPDFSARLNVIASAAGAESVSRYLKDRANKRNLLLYASPAGKPTVTDLNQQLEVQRRRVFQILTILMLVDAYAEHQLFAVGCLNAFLTLMDNVNDRMGRKSDIAANKQAEPHADTNTG